jgi:hypothetical protein
MWKSCMSPTVLLGALPQGALPQDALPQDALPQDAPAARPQPGGADGDTILMSTIWMRRLSFAISLGKLFRLRTILAAAEDL